ncbi:MAG: transglycosylase domain-containing protein [Lachnospiraceae bacterium]|nr:transglycosylase domain-containing protein [Lachnospiraceae bacterium]
MNFSKDETNKKIRNLKTRSKRFSSKLNVTAFRLFLLGVVFVVAVGVAAVAGIVKGLSATVPSIDLINVVPSGYASNTYFRDGTHAEILAGVEANRDYVEIVELPEYIKFAFVAMEDERFYEHDGIDMRGIMRALVSNLSTKSLDFGASTITQQLLKNQVFGGGNEDNPIVKLSRKIQEQFLAVELESRLSKDTILEYYINTVNYGNTAYGLQTAAKVYFSKDAKDLTLSEVTVLAAIPYSPTFQNPIHYPEDNKERRDKCLELMLKNGLCTQKEYDEAMADDPYSRIQMVAQEKTETSYYSYFTDAVIDSVINDLVERKGYTQAQATSMVYTGGLSIYTTQDRQIQDICDEVYTDESMFPAFGTGSKEGSLYELNYALSVQKPDGTAVHYQLSDLISYFDGFKKDSKVVVQLNQGVYQLLCASDEDMTAYLDEFYAAHVTEANEETGEPGDLVLGERRTFTPQPQSSFCIMDQSTGQIIALVGGRGEKTGSRTLNRATTTTRAVGSTFKVLASFLPAIDSAGMTLATPIDDTPYYYPNSQKEVINWWAKGKQEFFNGPFYGLNTIRRGISYSMNVVAVKTMERVTPQISFNYLKKLGFSTLVDSRYDESTGQTFSDINLSLALGGLTDGVTNLELTAAYATIANNGIYNKPYLYTKVLDHEGRVILSNEPQSSQVIKTSTSYLLTSAMQDTVSGGTGVGTGSRLRFKEYKMPVAGKTGTASNNNDLWFCGYTPYYTASIWSGFDNNFSQINQSYQQDMWRTIMERIHAEKQLPYKEFTIPDSVVTAKICTKSGKLAVDGVCDHAEGGSTVRTEYFAKGTVPLEKCDVHIKASVCWLTEKLAGPNCPAEDVVEKVLLVKTEPELLDWEGNVIEYTTTDTPNLLPTGEDAICYIHNEVIVTPDPFNPDVTPDPLNPIDPNATQTPTPDSPLPGDSTTETPDVNTPPVPTPTSAPIIFQ